MALPEKRKTELPIEIKFAQKLAANITEDRDNAVNQLQAWLSARSNSGKPLNDDEIIKIWKGLFYCMWMSDKPLVQEVLADHISGLISCFSTYKESLAFIRAFFITIIREWNGIDNLRYDKYLMLIRKFFNQSLGILKKNGWSEEAIEKFLEVLKEIPVNVNNDQKVPEAFQYHIIDIYLEELSKIGAKELSSEQNLKFLEPYFDIIAFSLRKMLIETVIKHIFQEIIEQSPFVRHKWKEAWLTHIDENDERACVASEENEEEKHLKFDYQAIVDRFRSYLDVNSFARALNRLIVKKLIKKFQSVVDGTYTVKTTVKLVDPSLPQNMILDALERLLKEETQILNLPENVSEDVAEEDSSPTVKCVEICKNQKRKKNGIEYANERTANFNDINDNEILPKKKKKKNKTNGKRKNNNNEMMNLNSYGENNTLPKKKRVKKIDETNIQNINLSQKRYINDSINLTLIDNSSENNKIKETKQIESQSGCSVLKSMKTEVEISKSLQKNNSIKVSLVHEDNDLTDNLEAETLAIEQLSTRNDSLSDGEVFFDSVEVSQEVEIFVPSKKFIKKLTNNKKQESLLKKFNPLLNFKNMKVPNTFIRLALKKAIREKKLIKEDSYLQNEAQKSSEKKKVNFAMSKNIAHDLASYCLSIEQQPSIPFDANKKPQQGVLKSSLIPSVTPCNKKKTILRGKRLSAVDFF